MCTTDRLPPTPVPGPLGQQPDPPGEDPAGEPPGGGLRERLHRHQRQLQPLREVPGDEVHAHRRRHGGQDLRVPPGEVPGHQAGRVRLTGGGGIKGYLTI